MKYTEDDVTNRLVDWIKNEADLDDLAAMYSEHTADQDDPFVVVVRGPNGPESEPYVNGRCVFGVVAAAPALLEGLKAAVESLVELAQYEDVARGMVQTGWFDGAVKAIAKAEGRGEA